MTSRESGDLSPGLVQAVDLVVQPWGSIGTSVEQVTILALITLL